MCLLSFTDLGRPLALRPYFDNVSNAFYLNELLLSIFHRWRRLGLADDDEWCSMRRSIERFSRENSH